MLVDLHSHSIHSDGLWTVSQLLQEAERKQIKYYAVTDHDTLEGSIDAFTTNKRLHLFSGVLVAGVEISTRVALSKIHLLTYLPTINIQKDSSFLMNLDKQKRSRYHRMELMVGAANDFGFKISMEEVIKIAQVGVPDADKTTASEILARPHLARLLVQKKYVKSMQEAFDEYLAEGKPLYRKRKNLTIEEWIKEVKKLGGLLIWAHPFHYHNNSLEQFQKALDIMEKLPINGVEFVYNYEKKYILDPTYKQQATAIMTQKIADHDWLITAGGDFHGDSGCLGELSLSEQDIQRFNSALFGIL